MLKGLNKGSTLFGSRVRRLPGSGSNGGQCPQIPRGPTRFGGVRTRSGTPVTVQKSLESRRTPSVCTNYCGQSTRTYIVTDVTSLSPKPHSSSHQIWVEVGND